MTNSKKMNTIVFFTVFYGILNMVVRLLYGYYTVIHLCIQLKLDSVGTVVKNSISSSNLGTLVIRWTDS